jgi:hypothetical protein
MPDVIPEKTDDRTVARQATRKLGLKPRPAFGGPRAFQRNDGAAELASPTKAVRNRGFHAARRFRPGNGPVVDPALGNTSRSLPGRRRGQRSKQTPGQTHSRTPETRGQPGTNLPLTN